MSDMPGYKHTPLGWIPEEWKIMKISQIGATSSGGTPDTSNPKLWNGEINWCTPTDITALNGNKHLGNTTTKISSIGLKNSSAKLLPINSLIICTRATIGKAAINVEPMSTNQGFKNLVAEKIDVDYLYYRILFDERRLTRIANGSTFLEVSKTDFDNFQVPIPTRKERVKIAAILGTWDKAIIKKQQLIAELRQRNKGLMQKLLSSERRLNGFVSDWKYLALSECLKYTPREVVKPSQNFFALGIRSHAKGIFHKNNFEPEDLAMDILYEVKENDLIVNITFAWEQAIAIAGKEDDSGLVSHRFPTYTFKKENAVIDFFRYLIIQKKFKYMLDLISPGGAGRNRVMSKKDFLKLEVYIPDVEEQQAIATILTAATNELKSYEQKLAALQQQKKGLMQKLLTGEIRVKGGE